MEGFWRSKRVLITGHSGFKGGWLALWLRHLGAQVRGYSLSAPTRPSLFEGAAISDCIPTVIADIRDLPRLQCVFDEFAPELVLHLAAQSLVRASYENPVETYSTNILGTVHVLEVIRRTKSVRSAVIVTSDKCYENREWERGYFEDDAMGGYDPYSSSKGCVELVTAAYRNSFFNPEQFKTHGVALASARAGNVIGGGDWAQDRLVPDVMRAALKGEPVRIRNPNAIRPWQHVLEPLHGYLMLAERLWRDGPEFAGGWNFGPAEEDAIPVGKVVEHLVAKWGDGARSIADAGSHPHEAHFLKLDCTKARSLLGWRPRLALVEALDWTVDWYRGYGRKADLKAICVEQIERYEGLEKK